MTIVSLTAPTGAFATGILCDDYAYAYSNTFTCATDKQRMSYIVYNAGTVSGINWRVEVSNDVNEGATGWYVQQSGTVATVTATGINIDTGFSLSRVGLRIDITAGTAVSGFAWVGVRG